jgi:hypothetical protein
MKKYIHIISREINVLLLLLLASNGDLVGWLLCMVKMLIIDSIINTKKKNIGKKNYLYEKFVRNLY